MAVSAKAEAEDGLSRSSRRVERAMVECCELTMGMYSMGHFVRSMSRSLRSSWEDKRNSRARWAGEDLSIFEGFWMKPKMVMMLEW